MALPNAKQAGQWLAAALLLAGTVSGLAALGNVLVIAAHGALDTDAAVYLTIGRGLLNGLQLYTTDFFEVQPPGIFLLSAASFLVTGDERFAIWMQIVAFLLIPALIALAAWNETVRMPPARRVAIIALATGMATLITLYLEQRAPGFETQAFGASLGTLYVFFAMRIGERWNPRAAIPAALALLGAVGCKEPFLLVLLASALLMAKSIRHFLHLFLIPLALAAAAGLVIMLGNGMLMPYLYSLNITAATRGGTEIFGPTYLRALATFPIHQNLTGIFPAAPLLGYLIWTLWSLVPTLHARSPRPRTILLMAIAFVTGIVLMQQSSLILQYWWGVSHEKQMTIYSIMGVARATRLVIPLSIAFLALSVLLVRQHVLQWVLLALVSVALTAAAVGSSVYAGNHFAFAVPVYAALVFLFVRLASSESRRSALWMPIAALAVLCLFQYEIPAQHEEYLRSRLGFTYEAQKETIDRLDGLLDACGVDRHYTQGVEEFATARHSPWGPFFTDASFMPDEHPYKQLTRENIERRALVLVMKDDLTAPRPQKKTPMNTLLWSLAESGTITSTPPSCAEPFLPIDAFTLWFRADHTFPTTPLTEPLSR